MFNFEKFDMLVEGLRPDNVIGKRLLKRRCVVFVNCADGKNHAFQLSNGYHVLEWKSK